MCAHRSSGPKIHFQQQQPDSSYAISSYYPHRCGVFLWSREHGLLMFWFPSSAQSYLLKEEGRSDVSSAGGKEEKEMALPVKSCRVSNGILHRASGGRNAWEQYGVFVCVGRKGVGMVSALVMSLSEKLKTWSQCFCQVATHRHVTRWFVNWCFEASSWHFGLRHLGFLKPKVTIFIRAGAGADCDWTRGHCTSSFSCNMHPLDGISCQSQWYPQPSAYCALPFYYYGSIILQNAVLRKTWNMRLRPY